MTNEIVFLDLFSGMGGFSKGFEEAGFTIVKHYFSEIEQNAIANYKYNFKNAEYVGTVENIRGKSLGKVDVITFGSPCQDFSLAGQRKGLAGERSSLIEQAIKIVIEKKPSFFIWENVKGSFSSNNSADFWAIIQSFANIGFYNIEWQLLNTLWILPQNRERIYLIGHITTAGRNFKPVFPFTENDRLFTIKKESEKRQSQTKHSTTIKGNQNRADGTFIAKTITNGGKGKGLHSDMNFLKLELYDIKQQNRIHNTNGSMSCLSKSCHDKTKIKIFSSQPRSGNPKKGGTGLLEKENSTYCLDTGNSNVIENAEQYRRLTEIECERLQGFSDDWTRFGMFLKSRKVRKYLFNKDKIWLTPTANSKLLIIAINNFKHEQKEIAMSNRYQLIGNSITKTFALMIAQRIKSNYNIL